MDWLWRVSVSQPTDSRLLRLAMLHGFLAGAAVALLLYAAATVGLPNMAVWALVLFLVAAAGGVILNLNYDWKQLPLPKWLNGVHATAAVAGFLLLLATTWATPQAWQRCRSLSAAGADAERIFNLPE